MIEIRQVERLHVDPRRADLREATDRVDDLRHGPGEVRAANPVGVLTYRLGASLHLGVVATATKNQCGGVTQAVHVSTSFGARVADPVELRGRRLDRVGERIVELISEPRGERGRLAWTQAADNDRRTWLLDRLRERRRLGQRVVLALEGEPLADGGRPQPGDDRQLLLEPLEPLAERAERDAIHEVLAVEPSGAEA